MSMEFNFFSTAITTPFFAFMPKIIWEYLPKAVSPLATASRAYSI